MFLWKKEKIILEKIESYRHHILECRNYFFQAMQKFFKQDSFDPLETLIENVHQYESKADDVRREIEYMLYNKALVPESREDILFILESMDALPNSFESLCYRISFQQITFPQEVINQLQILLKKNLHTVDQIIVAFIDFFYRKDILQNVIDIDNYESEIDKIEGELIKQIYFLNIEKSDKILLSSIVRKISNISDIAQNIGDRLVIAVTKRRF